MTDKLHMRDLKEIPGLRSCTYWEAVMKVKPLWDKGATSQVKLSIEATLFLVFERSSVASVRADLQRGTP